MSRCEKDGIVIMDFSGIYREEQFWKEEEHTWVSVQDIQGTNCYCDGDALEEIRKRLECFSGRGIHFLDSGNYHYMSRIWLEKIREPFQLLVLDNHTDMQPPAFGGLLSCGGWIESAFTELPNLKKILLVGPDKEAWDAVSPEIKEWTQFLSREELKDGRADKAAFILKTDTSLPLYISVDKDILAPGEAYTSWSQGDMDFEEMRGFLEEITGRFRSAGQKILGVDICGESDDPGNGSSEANDRVNQKLLTFFKEKGV